MKKKISKTLPRIKKMVLPQEDLEKTVGALYYLLRCNAKELKVFMDYLYEPKLLLSLISSLRPKDLKK